MSYIIKLSNLKKTNSIDFEVNFKVRVFKVQWYIYLLRICNSLDFIQTNVHTPININPQTKTTKQQSEFYPHSCLLT